MRRIATVALLAAGAAGCELEEITLVDAEDVVVAEVYVNLAANPEDHEIRAFLHRTVGTRESVADLFDARVTVRRSDGLSFVLSGAPVEDCVDSAPVLEPGACFLVDDSTTSVLAPGDIFEVEIVLPDGGLIFGAAQVPGRFDLAGYPATCSVPPDVLMEIEWSPSEGAWAYLNETSIRDLPAALEPEGIEVEEDPLYLLGLSVSDSDTSIVFPSQFGVFNRFDLDQDLAVRLQRGLPAGSRAQVSITAVDRNYVNWVRGGNFNPSGQVRIASLRGDGTGVFGATSGHSFQVLSGSDPIPSGTECPGVLPPE
jgi:hypothetical protein